MRTLSEEAKPSRPRPKRGGSVNDHLAGGNFVPGASGGAEWSAADWTKEWADGKAMVAPGEAPAAAPAADDESRLVDGSDPTMSQSNALADAPADEEAMDDILPPRPSSPTTSNQSSVVGIDETLSDASVRFCTDLCTDLCTKW